jgi:hypothetical protein
MSFDKFQIKIIESWCKSNGFEIENYGGFNIGIDIFYLNNVSDEYDNQVAQVSNWGDWLRFKTWAISAGESKRSGEFETYNP